VITTISNIRKGFEAACLALGLLALALLLRNVWFGSVAFDLSAPMALVEAPVHQVIANEVLQSLLHVFLIGLVLLVASKGLLRQEARAKDLLICLVVGLAAGVLINMPFHKFLISVFFTSDLASESTPVVMDIKRVITLFCVNFTLTCVLVPIAEELSARGQLFDETSELPRLHTAFWSILMFCFAHYLTFGLTKVIAVLPMAVLFVMLRFRYGSWKHSAAAHAGVNSVATIADYMSLSGLLVLGTSNI
jgi:membrane protease YdiL (CAAX protease family)